MHLQTKRETKVARAIVYSLTLSTRTDSVRLALREEQVEYDFVDIPYGTDKKLLSNQGGKQ